MNTDSTSREPQAPNYTDTFLTARREALVSELASLRAEFEPIDAWMKEQARKGREEMLASGEISE